MKQLRKQIGSSKQFVSIVRKNTNYEGVKNMKTFNVEVSFIDGTTVTIEVEAENIDEALDKAMPINFRV